MERNENNIAGKTGVVVAVCLSDVKGIAKWEVPSADLVENHGIKDDAHAGNWHRQVSLLSHEKVEEFRSRGGNVQNGAFGENILISGIDCARLPVGTLLSSGDILLEVTQIGKECHAHCAIYHQVGDCIMPREGIFTKVLKGGTVKKGDVFHVEKPLPGSGADSQR